MFEFETHGALEAGATDRVRKGLRQVDRELERVQAALEGVSGDLRGDAWGIAARMGRHVRFLQEVAQLLRHEVAQLETPEEPEPLAQPSL